jgi:hypothetical protein
MKRRSLVFMVLCIICLASCQQKPVNEISYTCSVDTLNYAELNLDFSTRSNFTIIEEVEKRVILAQKSFFSDTMYFFDIEQKELIKKILLPPSMQDTSSYGHITKIDFIDRSKILVIQLYRFSVYDFEKDSICNEFVFSTKDSLFYTNNAIWNYNNNKILAGLIRVDNYKNRKHEMDTEFMAEIDIETFEIEILPVKYPKEYETNQKYMPFPDQLITNHNGFYVVSYPITPLISIYNSKTRIIEEKEINHANYQQCIEFDTTKAREKDYYVYLGLHSFRYVNFIYDKYKNRYYRFFELELEERNEDGLLNTYNDKKYGATVISEDFDVIGDFIIDIEGEKNFLPFSSNWVVTKNGLVSCSINNKKKNILIYTIKLNEDDL